MQAKFISDLENTFSSHSFNKIFSFALNLYVQEVNSVDANNRKIKCTELAETEPNERHFKILNNSGVKVAHICIDGDFIPFGQAKYDAKSPKYKDGRPESIVFTENILIFLELKVEQDIDTFEKKDDVKWATFFKGLTQIEDFVRFLRSNFIEVNNYFQKVEAVICMRFEPRLISNAKRNTELLRRATALGFRVAPPHKHEEPFTIS